MGVHAYERATGQGKLGDRPGRRSEAAVRVFRIGGRRPPRPTAGLSPYALSKLLFDRTVAPLLPAAGSPLVGLRLFNVYGPGEGHKGPMASVVRQFHRQLRASGVIEIYQHPGIGPPGSQRRDLVHVDDVVAATCWFLDHGGSGIYDVGTGTATSFEQLARIVIGHEGAGAIRYTPLPGRLVGSYQSFTQADLGPLRAAGFTGGFRAAESGVPAYLRGLDAIEAP